MILTTPSCLVIGGSGFVGYHLAQHLKDEFKVIATYYKHPMQGKGVTYLPFEVGNRDWIKRVIYSFRPDVIIYVAGNNSLEYAEQKPPRAERGHSVGVASVVNLSDLIQPRFIYISNGYVFDGFRGNYHEDDTVLPGTVLGRAKNGGESIIKTRCLNYVIIRSSPLLGRGNGYNLSTLDQWRLKLEKKQKIEIGLQETHSFSHISHFCEFTRRVIHSSLKNKTIHYGGLTKLPVLEMAKIFADSQGFDRNLISLRRKKNADQNLGENFMFDFSLNFTRAINQLHLNPLSLENCVDLLRANLLP